MLFLGDFSASNGPKRSSEALCSVPKHQEAVMCLMEKTRVLSQLGSAGVRALLAVASR